MSLKSFKINFMHKKCFKIYNSSIKLALILKMDQSNSLSDIALAANNLFCKPISKFIKHSAYNSKKYLTWHQFKK